MSLAATTLVNQSKSVTAVENCFRKYPPALTYVSVSFAINAKLRESKRTVRTSLSMTCSKILQLYCI